MSEQRENIGSCGILRTLSGVVQLLAQVNSAEKMI